jgi:predicted RNA-binding protein YlxR (DUF448 family)
MREKPELLRIVRDSGGEVQADPSGKASGRGAYICRNGECLKKARQHKGLERSFKKRVASEVYDQIQMELNASGNQESI